MVIHSIIFPTLGACNILSAVFAFLGAQFFSFNPVQINHLDHVVFSIRSRFSKKKKKNMLQRVVQYLCEWTTTTHSSPCVSDNESTYDVFLATRITYNVIRAFRVYTYFPCRFYFSALSLCSPSTHTHTHTRCGDFTDTDFIMSFTVIFFIFPPRSFATETTFGLYSYFRRVADDDWEIFFDARDKK